MQMLKCKLKIGYRVKIETIEIYLFEICNTKDFTL